MRNHNESRLKELEQELQEEGEGSLGGEGGGGGRERGGGWRGGRGGGKGGGGLGGEEDDEMRKREGNEGRMEEEDGGRRELMSLKLIMVNNEKVKREMEEALKQNLNEKKSLQESLLMMGEVGQKSDQKIEEMGREIDRMKRELAEKVLSIISIILI